MVTRSTHKGTGDHPPANHAWGFQRKLQAGQLCLRLILCEGEVIVQGDEGPVRGVAQVVDCHGVSVGHEEREEEVEERQEVESDGEKTLKERCACPWMG